MKANKIPTILGIFILIVGVAVGIFLVQQPQIFRLGAEPEVAPRDVRITNITDSSFTVTWITDREVISYLLWGDNANPSTPARESDDLPKTMHRVTLDNLNSNDTYYFKISSSGENYDNSGTAWQTLTGQDTTPQSNPRIVSGTVVDGSGNPASGVFVYLSSAATGPMSTKTNVSGEWVIALTTAATINDNTEFEIFVQGGQKGIATAQILAQSANPAPVITIGKTHDFRQEPPNEIGGAPGANIELPDGTGVALGVSTVTIDSVDDGETIFTAEPEFFGTAPSSTMITIKIESELQSDTLVADSFGNWNWSPPDNLDEGEHSVTIEWEDEGGFLQSLTKHFTVLAAEDDPSFESTPSATPTPTPSATPTATPTATPRSSLPSTDSGIPVAGSIAPTYMLALMGLGLLLLGFTVSFKASRT